MERQYEAMFLLDANWASKDWEAAEAHVKALVEKVGGAIVQGKRWDERKLAYPIRQQHTMHRRGVYYLTHLSLPTEAVAPLHREIELDDHCLRIMVLATRPDHVAWIFEPFPEVETSRQRREKADREASPRPEPAAS